MHKIEVADDQTKSFDPSSLIAIVECILEEHGIAQSEISIAVVDDPAIRAINKQYLDHDYETDVISFVLEADDDRLCGQLVVSTDTAERFAAEFGYSMQEELMLYVAHGTLHLVGLDDKTPALAAEMRAAEKAILDSFGVPHRWEHANSKGDE